MDLKTPPILQQAPVNMPPVLPKKMNVTNLLIIIVVLIAVLFTAGAYVVTSQKSSSKKPTVTPTPKVITAEDVQWQQYLDTKNNFTFYYPETWMLKNSSSDPTAFTLTYTDAKKPGMISGRILSQAEKDKTVLCDNVKEANHVCRSSDLTASTKLFIELNYVNNLPTKVNAFITRPDQSMINFNVTQPNFDSYQTIAIILDTIRFKGEKPSGKIQICPDSWSTNKDLATYHGVTFPASEIDQDFIKTDCKK